MSITKKETHTKPGAEELEEKFPYKKFPGEPTATTKKSERILKGTDNNRVFIGTDIDAKKEKELKGLDAKQTMLKRKELDLDHPHQLDRHSGTGISAYDKREKKGGGGVHNWGSKTVDEDFERPEVYDVEEQVSVQNQDTLPVSENAVTFDEYMGKQGNLEIHQAVNEIKEKVSESELLKEIGKAVPLKTKEDEEKEVPQTKKIGDDYHMSMQTQHADLLGFKVEPTEEQPKADETKEKAHEPHKNPIKKAIDFVGEKLGLRPPSDQVVKGVFLQDDQAFPKLD